MENTEKTKLINILFDIQWLSNNNINHVYYMHILIIYIYCWVKELFNDTQLDIGWYIDTI